MIERPALRLYFYGGKSCPENDPLCAEVVTVGELLADVMNQGIVTHETNPQSTSAAPWDDYCRTTLASSPVLRELIAVHPKWWPRPRCPLPDATLTRTARPIDARGDETGSWRREVLTHTSEILVTTSLPW